MEVSEVLRQWGLGYGLRRIARATGMDRKTVRRYVTAAQVAGLTRERAAAVTEDQVSMVMDAVRVGSRGERGETWRLCEEQRLAIQGWVDQGLQLTKVHELLKRLTGQSVVYRTLHRFVTQEMGHGRRDVTVRVAESGPGEVVEIDFGLLGRMEEVESGRSYRVYGLIFTAAYSRHQYVFLSRRQTLETMFEGFERAWAFFGGVFRVVVLDNAKTVITDADPCSPTITPRFLAYSRDRGFVVDATRVRSPRDKPHVERMVQYVRRSFWQGESFRSLAEAQERAEWWCREVAGRRVHGTTRRRPLEVFESEERGHLLLLPEGPYQAPLILRVRVHRDHHVSVDRALYSVPTAYIGEEVTVRADRDLVKIYHRGHPIKVHPRQPPGGCSTDAKDYPEEVAIYARRDSQALLEKAQQAGQHVGIYAERLLEGPLPWTRMRHLYRLLGLVEKFGASRVEQACARSLALDVIDVTRIGRMLARALEGRTPPEPTSAGMPGVVLRFARPASDFATTRSWRTSNDD